MQHDELRLGAATAMAARACLRPNTATTMAARASQERRRRGAGWEVVGGVGWYVANTSIIFDAPCLFYTNCFMFLILHDIFMHFLELTC
jgi:hypothetical protein